MVKAVSSFDSKSIASQASQSGTKWSGLMQEYLDNLQGIYYEVHVECINPDVTTMGPVVLKTNDNFPEEYTPQAGTTKFDFQLEQIEKCKEIVQLLHKKALVVQLTLEDHYEAMADEYRVIIAQRKR